jgi:hypothetical protein
MWLIQALLTVLGCLVAAFLIAAWLSDTEDYSKPWKGEGE